MVDIGAGIEGRIVNQLLSVGVVYEGNPGSPLRPKPGPLRSSGQYHRYYSANRSFPEHKPHSFAESPQDISVICRLSSAFQPVQSHE